MHLIPRVGIGYFCPLCSTAVTKEHISELRALFKLPEAAQEKIAVCALPDCSEGARKRSKYCSRNCSNKNARQRFSERKTSPTI